MLGVKSMDENDVAAVACLEKECFGNDAWSENLIRNELADSDKHYFVIYEDDVAVAYGGFNKIVDEGHINNIAVGRDYRRKGYGSLILKSFFRLARDMGILSFTLEVKESNSAARNLYEKSGFVLEGVRPRYYRNGENACIYWKYGLDE